jgi:hypothetical protein
MTTTTYGWNIDTKGRIFPKEYATYETYWDKLTNDYVIAVGKAWADGSIINWTHANCDHANNYCQKGEN